MIRRLPKKPKREPWIPLRKKVDHSSMSCCKEAKERDRLLRAMGCIVCRRKTEEVHHLREGVGMGERAPWWRTIPLCIAHHANSSPYSVHGRDRARFFKEQGTEQELLDRVNARLPARLTAPPDPSPSPISPA